MPSSDKIYTWGDVARVHGWIKAMVALPDGSVVIATERRIFRLKEGRLSKMSFALDFDLDKESADWMSDPTP